MSKTSARHHRNISLWVILIVLACLPASCSLAEQPSAPPPVSTLRVVMDEYYPPYVFRDSEGELQGILIDHWALWSQRTGVAVEITAMPWGDALNAMRNGEFDVIDTIFYTAERDQVFDFTEAYATIDVVIFFQENISGIAEAQDLKGFRVAVKSGDANAEFLLQRGITDLVYYDSYEQIIQAASRKEEVIFVIDRPPGLYYLYKYHIESQFNYSAPLYSGAFHRAVKQGDQALLNLVTNGFSSIHPDEYQEIDERWFGIRQAIVLNKLLPYLSLGVGVALLLILALVVFNRTLQSQVRQRTREVQEALDSLQKSEQALREYATQYQVLVDNTHDVIARYDAAGKILYVSPASQSLLGYAPAKLVGALAMDLVHPAEVEKVKQSIAAAAKAHQDSYRIEHRMRHRTGNWVWMETVGRLTYTPEGDLEEIQCSVRNISERKQAEEKLRKSEADVRKLNAELERRVAERTAQLQSANRELEAFAYSVSHDLRAPLRAVDGYARILVEDHAPQLNADALELLQRVRKESNHMGQLINALLTLSRMSRLEMYIETVSLSDLAHVVVASLRQANPERQVEVQIAEGVLVQGDSRLLRVAMENLLNNAWKFTSRREQGRIEFGVQHEGEKTVYFVRDNGAGFDMAYANKLFGAFQRLHSAGEFEGTGVGLATVQRIIARHNGTVWAEAGVDQGATFYFTL